MGEEAAGHLTGSFPEVAISPVRGYPDVMAISDEPWSQRIDGEW